MVKPIQDSEEAAKRLMQEAYQRGSADNITCVVVRFMGNHSHSQGDSSKRNGDSSNRSLENHQQSDPSNHVSGNQPQ